MHTLTRWSATFVIVILLIGMVGCGTNLNQILFQSGTAMGRTAFDLFLTDLANAIADGAEADDDAADTDDADDDDTDADDDADADDDDDDADDDGDDDGVIDGAGLYADNCSACHGADGASGFAAAVVGFTADELAVGLESATHGSISLTDDEVAALAEFLAG